MSVVAPPLLDDETSRSTGFAWPLLPAGMSSVMAVHPRRLALLQYLVASPEGATVAELATALKLTPAAVRLHLAKLVASGLVQERRLPPAGPGRPRHRYQAAGSARALLASGGLLEQLAGMLAESPGPAAKTGGRPGGQETQS